MGHRWHEIEVEMMDLQRQAMDKLKKRGEDSMTCDHCGGDVPLDDWYRGDDLSIICKECDKKARQKWLKTMWGENETT